MKKLQLLLLPALLVACTSVERNAPAPVNAGNAVGVPTVEARSHAFVMVEQCLRGNGNCAMAYDSSPLTLRTPRVRVSVHDGKLDLLYLSPVDPAVMSFFLSPENEYYVDADVARDLGYKSIRVLSGSYQVDRTRGEFGGLLMNARAQ